MSTTFDLSTLTNPANGGIIYNGIYANSWTGSSVASAGDFNNDGYDDVIISAPLSSPGGATSAGETYVVYGNKQHLIITDSVDFTLTDDSGNSINSSFNIEIYPVNSEPEGEPEINAETTPEPGDLITVSTSGITDADGLSTLFRYQWYSAGQVIIDANDSSYTVSADDLGNQISVDVSYTDDEGFIETFTVNAGVVSDITPPTITLLNTPDNLSSDQQDIVILGYLNENGSLEGGVGNTVVSNLQVFDSLAASIELGVSTTANTRNGMFIKLAEDGSGHITNGSSINKEHHFYFPVSLEPGTNLIRLTATDDYSNSNTKYLPITYQHSTITNSFNFPFEPGDSWERFESPHPALRVAETGFRWAAYKGVGNVYFFSFHVVPNNADEIWVDLRANVGVNGAYAYTIFDTTGGNTPNTSVNDLQSITVDWPFVNSAMNTGFAKFIIKDANGEWFITNNEVDIEKDTTFELFVADATWSRISSINDLDNITDNQAGELNIEANVSTPDLSKILGGGIYFNGFTNTDSLALRFDNLTFVGR